MSNFSCAYTGFKIEGMQRLIRFFSEFYEHDSPTPSAE